METNFKPWKSIVLEENRCKWGSLRWSWKLQAIWGQAELSWSHSSPRGEPRNFTNAPIKLWQEAQPRLLQPSNVVHNKINHQSSLGRWHLPKKKTFTRNIWRMKHLLCCIYGHVSSGFVWDKRLLGKLEQSVHQWRLASCCHGENHGELSSQSDALIFPGSHHEFVFGSDWCIAATRSWVLHEPRPHSTAHIQKYPKASRRRIAPRVQDRFVKILKIDMPHVPYIHGHLAYLQHWPCVLHLWLSLKTIFKPCKCKHLVSPGPPPTAKSLPRRKVRLADVMAASSFRASSRTRRMPWPRAWCSEAWKALKLGFGQKISDLTVSANGSEW